MAPTPVLYAWKISWMEGPGGLPSMGLQRVRHDWATSLSLFTFMHWRRKWQPTPVFLPGESQGRGSLVVFLPGESQGRGSLVGCRLWGRTESDTTEATQRQQQDQRVSGLRVGKEGAGVSHLKCLELKFWWQLVYWQCPWDSLGKIGCRTIHWRWSMLGTK